jgi:hypothetical protein
VPEYFPFPAPEVTPPSPNPSPCQGEDNKRKMFVALLLFLASACTLTAAPVPPKLPVAGVPQPTATYTPFQPLPPESSASEPQATRVPPSPFLIATDTPLPVPSPAVNAPAIWLAPGLPAALTEALAGHLEWASPPDPQQAALRIEVGGERPVSRWVYALVAPFTTLAEGVSADVLRRAWQGQPAGPFAGKPLRMEGGTLAVFTALWGPPAEGAVQIGEVTTDLALSRRRLWAIVPFEALDPRWKVLPVDGQSPLHKDFDPAAYPLTAPISLAGDPGLAAQVAPWLPATNRDPARLTVVALTGTTALVRATAFTMEKRGINYPAKDVGDILRLADIAHVSNEVPFAKDCPFPDPLTPDMRFCSDPKYIELLETIGTDVVELTGDHFQDWGVEAMRYTLALYNERGWGHYGGGADLEDARQPLLIEHNGNRLAFIGCNAKGGSFAQAAPRHPGAAPCDMDWLAAEVARLSRDGTLPIVTFQHFEYYTYKPQPNQERDFRRVADAGAVIVSGSQAHQPQGMEFMGDHFIHYGLGNLFFDQYDVSAATRQAFIDRHVFYAGRYIGVELLPIVFVDYARPRLMTTDEADELLEAVFSASGW